MRYRGITPFQQRELCRIYVQSKVFILKVAEKNFLAVFKACENRFCLRYVFATASDSMGCFVMLETIIFSAFFIQKKCAIQMHLAAGKSFVFHIYLFLQNQEE